MKQFGYCVVEKKVLKMSDVQIYQALNSGIVLMDLEKLRERPELFTPQYFLSLQTKYNYAHFGDQVKMGHFHYSNDQNIPEGFSLISCKYLHVICFAGNLRTK